MRMATMRYYEFLNVALDVFCGVILYSMFIVFRGFTLSSLLLAFAVFVILDYWWNARSSKDWPKHDLIDFLFVIVIMFIFAQWPNYFGDLQKFLLVLISLLFIDAFFSVASIYVHKESHYKKLLWYFAGTELALGAVYTAIFLLNLPFTFLSVVFVIIPYMSVYFMSLKLGYIPTKFVNYIN